MIMRRTLAIGAFAMSAAFTSHASAAAVETGQDLANLSIEQLAQLEIRSVSKRPEPLSEAPASLYVIDHDQIVRSGAVTLPEILRLAPNLQVYQQTPAHWVVTARGLNGAPFAQSFSNKLLVMVDGRTVYTPLFSGVYWDMPDLLPDDIERIEVISGPGATQWGANAVNGVINIITRNSSSTTGAYAHVQAGTSEQVAGLRFGGQASPDLSYRVYAKGLRQDAFEIPGDGSARDKWHRLGGGFRLDWTPTSKDSVMFEGDIFSGRDEQLAPGHESLSGRDLVVRWNRESDAGQHLQVQAFYDRSSRDSRSAGGGSFVLDTYDVDLQHSLPLGPRNTLVWGGGARVGDYRITGTPSFFFEPSSRDLFLANAFVQDTFALSPKLSVTGGLKAERDPYVGLSLLPEVRVAFKPAESTLLWASMEHAVRSPTPFDVDVQERVPGVTLSGNRDFRTEKLTAYELGVRAQPLAGLSFSATAFYHDYDDLRSVELGSGPGLDLYWGNGLAGHSYGLEAWASTRPMPWWTLSAGMTLLKEDFHFKRGSTALLPTYQNGIDPGHQFTLRSAMNLGSSVMLDLDLRSVGRLENGGIPAYAELGGRLAWNVSDHLTLTVSGANLLHDHHVEYMGGDAIPRRVLAGLEWRP